MNEYPVMIRLDGKSVVVIGGGRVAERKVRTLLETNGDVKVISPAITVAMSEWVRSGKLNWSPKEFEPQDLEGAFLVIGATNQRELNQRVLRSVPEHSLVNIVDDPDNSTFIMPSLFRRGRLTVSVSTSGASPGLAKRIRDELANRLDEAYEEYAEFLYQCRQNIKAEVADSTERQAILTRLLEEDFLQLTRSKQYEERNERFRKLCRKESSVTTS